MFPLVVLILIQKGFEFCIEQEKFQNNFGINVHLQHSNIYLHFLFSPIFCNFKNLCLAYNTTGYKLAQSPVKRKKALCLHNFSGAVGKKCPRAQKNLPW